MKTLNSFIVLIVLALFSFNINAQELEVHYGDTILYNPPGIAEIVFDIEIVNISALVQTVFLVRTVNDLPAGLGWSSSLCFGINCYSPNTDSVATSGAPFPDPLQPDSTLEASVHVFTQSNVGTAYIQVQIGTFRNPDVRTTINYIATTDSNAVSVEDEFNLSSYELEQNYPNPFNPSTQINYNVGEGGLVKLSVYNILGIEVATLVNEYKPAGGHQVSFDGNNLSSGVYIYNLSVNNYTKTRKMILEK